MLDVSTSVTCGRALVGPNYSLVRMSQCDYCLHYLVLPRSLEHGSVVFRWVSPEIGYCGEWRGSLVAHDEINRRKKCHLELNIGFVTRMVIGQY